MTTGFARGPFPRREGGLSLIELLISASILALAILTYLVVDVQNRRAQIISWEITVAENAMRSKIEEVKAAVNDATLNGPNTSLLFLLGDAEGDNTGDANTTDFHDQNWGIPGMATDGSDWNYSPGAWTLGSDEDMDRDGTPDHMPSSHTCSSPNLMHTDIVDVGMDPTMELVEVTVVCRWRSKSYGKTAGALRTITKVMKTKIADPTPAGS